MFICSCPGSSREQDCGLWEALGEGELVKGSVGWESRVSPKGRFHFRSSNRAYKKGELFGQAGRVLRRQRPGECIQGWKRGMLGEKAAPWEQPGARRKLEVKRDAGGKAVGLGEELRRGSRPSMCGGKVQGCAAALLGKPLNQHYTQHSQLAFVVLFFSPHFFLPSSFSKEEKSTQAQSFF